MVCCRLLGSLMLLRRERPQVTKGPGQPSGTPRLCASWRLCSLAAASCPSGAARKVVHGQALLMASALNKATMFLADVGPSVGSSWCHSPAVWQVQTVLSGLVSRVGG